MTPRGQTESPSDREVMRPTSHSSHFQSAAGGFLMLADAAGAACPPNWTAPAAPFSVEPSAETASLASACWSGGAGDDCRSRSHAVTFAAAADSFTHPSSSVSS